MEAKYHHSKCSVFFLCHCAVVSSDIVKLRNTHSVLELSLQARIEQSGSV